MAMQAGSPARAAGALGWKAWLQERQYATAYHWRQAPNDEREYRLRTDVVLRLAHLAGPERPAARPRLLDVGCGDARFTADATLRAHVVGVDVSRRALGHARDLAPLAHFAASSGGALPFPSNSFDVVTILDVIEHIPDVDERRVVAEAHRVLRPGGRLVISTNTDRSACELKHYRHYSIARFRSLFAGLERLELAGIIPYFPTLKMWMATPLLWRLTASRIRTCAAEEAHVVVGAATKP
ncbi:MAG TPA: methyltransferase domain-containing protein [Vicinamibacterales bacterium]|nr:methyltransferase domain-containing protein [Vicinamibacterales bacterium]